MHAHAPSPIQPSSKALDDLRAQNEALQRQLTDVQHYAQQLEGSRDRTDAYLGRLASSMDGMLAATAKGNTRVRRCDFVIIH